VKQERDSKEPQQRLFCSAVYFALCLVLRFVLLFFRLLFPIEHASCENVLYIADSVCYSAKL
jgi:hypothetical protein